MGQKMMKKGITFVVAALVIISLLAGCGKKKAQDVAVVTEEPTPTVSSEVVVTPTPQISIPPEQKKTPEEVKEIQQEQKKVVEKAKVQEKQAEKEVAKKVVTSSVAESAAIPEGFPVSNVPIIQGAQIVSASKAGGAYAMVLRVNIPAADAYSYYFELYDATGSVKITQQVKGQSLSIERAKSGLKADFNFANESEATSTVTINVTVQ